MLVIGRRPVFEGRRRLPAAVAAERLSNKGHGVWIGPDVLVRILRIEVDGTVQIGISAPREITVCRDELEGWAPEI